MLTQPTDGRLPTTDVEYRNMISALRRLGHIIEHSRDNIATGIRVGKGSGKSHSYVVEELPSNNNFETSYPQWYVTPPTPSWNDWQNPTWNEQAWLGHDTPGRSDWTPSQPSSGSGWNLSEWADMYPTIQEADSGTDTDTVSSVGDT